MAVSRGGLPVPADFAAPPSPRQLRVWAEADRAARPARLARLRARFAEAGVDAYFGVRREHMRYLTGFSLAEGEEKSAGNSGQLLVTGSEVVVLADSRYTVQARRECPDARVFEAYRDLPQRWPELNSHPGVNNWILLWPAVALPHAIAAALGLVLFGLGLAGRLGPI